MRPISGFDKYLSKVMCAKFGDFLQKWTFKTLSYSGLMLWTKGTHSMDISEWCHASNRVRALWHALSSSTRLRKLPDWSYGENDSSPWTPECILTSVLTNTSQLAQRIPGQPGRHSTGCVHRLAGQEWTCWSGFFPQRTRNLWLWHQADHATPTGLPRDGHCLLSPRPDNG